MTEEEFRALLWRELANPETKRVILGLVVEELRRAARASMGGTAPLHHALNYLGQKPNAVNP